jgi:hypothetical protein
VRLVGSEAVGDQFLHGVTAAVDQAGQFFMVMRGSIFPSSLHSEVAKAPETVRQKFIRPAAEAVSGSSTLDRARLVSGMKKNDKPTP